MEILNLIFINYFNTIDNLMVLAYIDPGTGSIILQAIVATVVGVGIALKLFWHRILKFLGIRKSTTKSDSINPKSDK